MKSRPLTHRRETYIRLRANGLPSREAALQAGFSKSYSKVAATRLGKLPAVKAAVDEVQMEGRKMASYDLATALTDCDRAAEFARKNKNSMALVKSNELKAKLAGLLIERVEQVTVSIKEALELAKERALGRKTSEGTITILPIQNGNGSDEPIEP